MSEAKRFVEDLLRKLEESPSETTFVCAYTTKDKQGRREIRLAASGYNDEQDALAMALLRLRKSLQGGS